MNFELPRLEKFLNFEIFHFAEYQLKVYTLLSLVLIYVISRLVIWFIYKVLERRSKFKKLDEGSSFALYQLLRYLIWVIAIALAFEAIGISLTVILAGSAALLVGIGLGLQQTFNDIVSGVILLTEGSTKVGDVLEIEDEVVIVQKIGLRTSKVMNRDYINVIVPNSLITTRQVINWSHQSKETRFTIEVHVTYDADVEMVIRLLEESVSEHPKVLQKRRIASRLRDFQPSGLLFDVTFISEAIFRIERIKSEIRKNIIQKFRENDIVIPYPQRELHIRPQDRKLFDKGD